jgi:tetratricopeptide (TPR) repeat protein
MSLHKLSAPLPRLLLALACAALVTGCAHQEVPVDPDEQLETYVRVWEAQQEGDRGEDAVVEAREVADPELLQAKLEQLALEFPTHVPTLYVNGLVAFDAGQPEKAQTYLDRVLRLQPSHPDAAVLRAQVAVTDGGLPFARRLLERQAQLAPQHAGLHEALSGVLFLQSEHEAARAELLLAERLGAPRWRVSYHLGLLDEQLGDLAAAEVHYRDAVAANKDHALARQRLDGLLARRPRER